MKRIFAVAAAVLVLAGAAWVYDNYHGLARDSLERRRYPALQRADDPLAASMEEDIERRKRRRAVEEYQEVLGMLAEAEAHGFDVRALRAKMPRVERLLGAKDYFNAGLHLRSIRLRVPRKSESVRLASGDEGADDYFPQPRGRPQKKARLLRSSP
ncbi:MAG: hypothetical protein WC728_07055 [Elusimicrobiota bacterium]